MEIKRIELMKADLGNGVLIGRQSLVELVDHALDLHQQRSRMAQVIVDQLFPRLQRNDNGPDFVRCPACGSSVPGSQSKISQVVHEDDCLYVEARDLITREMLAVAKQPVDYRVAP